MMIPHTEEEVTDEIEVQGYRSDGLRVPLYHVMRRGEKVELFHSRREAIDWATSYAEIQEEAQ